MYNELPAACMLSPDGTQHSEWHHVTMNNGVGHSAYVYLIVYVHLCKAAL